MKLAIVGTGYVGLVTGTCFAEMGNEVVCVDIDAQKIDKLNRGELPIFEPGLEIYYERNRREGRLHFTTSLEEALPESEVIFLALPTPPGEDGSADLSYVLGVADQIAQWMAAHPETGYKIIVNKSTVPVGTADRVREIFESYGLTPGEQFDVVSNPEFLREGVAVDDFMKPERVIIGTRSPRAAEIMTQLYEPFVRQGNPILVMDERSSEMTKYAANAFLATKITFMNEIANVCERVGANVDEVRRGIGLDSRIGKQFLYAGIGFGGSCFPKDVKALARTAEEHGYAFQILKAVLDVNERQRRLLAERVYERFDGQLEGRRLAIWGLAFKANTDDVREAPSHVIIRKLLEHGADIVVFDPEAMENTRAVFGDAIRYARSMYEALEGAEALVICTEWNEFRRPDFQRMRDRMARPLIFDGRNLYHPKRMAAMGFEYYSIGRPHYPPHTNPDPALLASTTDGKTSA
ncbi:UDP-glucose dehydrogenase family protein [Rhodothermus profundi]|uniref:UDP-glucose 6-dehydrogenase n=1 Tax=Rhodothermus profundi TaxID=633813 RepID=A0A1M6QKL5_9BACT|nr:UDP-glucose/GDP-mannose dehydrogenase family protein [Rhodothermus profundi]SHK20557.1 UDP-glucose dehydrogenase [Rhodothermus profundi]